ncbi:MAG: YwaF family protein [Firmicutes bacterium]|nr:YwaF family protein [Bacillota bacterium]
MFNVSHIIYIIVSLAVTAGALTGFHYIKNQRWKDFVLKTCALLTFVLHISIMWVDFFTTGEAMAFDNILLPVYFCNLCMYLFMVVAFMPNKHGRAFRILATFLAYGAFFGGMITLFASEYLMNDPYMESYETVKSLFSHSVMMLGCLYLFVGGYVKIGVANIIPFLGGMIASLALGIVINLLYYVFDLGDRNAMYLQGTAMEGVEFLNGYFIGGLILVLVFAFVVIFEQFAKKKGERWYNKSFKEFLAEI